MHFLGKDAGSAMGMRRRDHSSQPGASSCGTHPKGRPTVARSRRLRNGALAGAEDALGPQVTSVALGSQYAELMGVSVALAG